jgi:LmbE family N-acetylglucosaminyl deacetylase
MLGLPSSQVHLLNLPDIEVVRDLDRTADLVSSVMDRIRPTTIFATAFEGGHPDHDAVNFLAYEGMRRAGLKAELLEFPLYNFTGPMHHGKWRINSFPPTDSPCLYTPLTDRAIDVKYRLMRTYTSQWMYMIPARLACSRSRMTDPGEPYRRYPAVRDHTVRPHEGKLLYEHWFSSWLKTRFEDFSVAVSRSRWCGPE